METSTELRDVIHTYLYPVIKSRSMSKRQRSRNLVATQKPAEMERKFLEEIELPAKKFDNAFTEYGIKMSVFFSQIHLKSEDRS